jgi:DNA modification methylase
MNAAPTTPALANDAQRGSHWQQRVVSPIFEDSLTTIYHGDCREILPMLGRFDLMMTDPPYEMEQLPDCLWGVAPCAYIFGDKRQVAENWYRQTQYSNKDFLVWHYKNSPKPKGRWRMSMQAIIYGWENGVAFDEDAARVEYTPSAKRLNGRMRPSSGRMETAKAYDTSKGALPRDVIEWPALLGHLSRERVGHRDQKPVELIKRLIQTVPNVRRIVDPFGGSGTTAVAAAELGIPCVLIEDDFEDCRMAMARIGANASGEPHGPNTK